LQYASRAIRRAHSLDWKGDGWKLIAEFSDSKGEFSETEDFDEND
jgi:hypothetical protein